MRTTTTTWRRLVAAGAASLFVACAQGEQQASQPAESTAAMADVPAPKAQPAAPAPAAPPKKAPPPAVPKPSAPAAPTTFTLAAGTRMALAAADTISTRHAKAGDPFTATVSEDVRDAA